VLLLITVKPLAVILVVEALVMNEEDAYILCVKVFANRSVDEPSP
jgi:hypothetical protein